MSGVPTGKRTIIASFPYYRHWGYNERVGIVKFVALCFRLGYDCDSFGEQKVKKETSSYQFSLHRFDGQPFNVVRQLHISSVKFH